MPWYLWLMLGMAFGVCLSLLVVTLIDQHNDPRPGYINGKEG